MGCLRQGSADTLRGGSFANNNDNNVRCAYRNNNSPNNRNNNWGFRVVEGDGTLLHSTTQHRALRPATACRAKSRELAQPIPVRARIDRAGHILKGPVPNPEPERRPGRHRPTVGRL